MDPNQYHFAYIPGKTAHQPAAPLPIPAAPRNIVYLRRADGSMLPIHSANGGFLPASARVPRWTTAHQAAQSKAAEERNQQAANKKKEADEAQKAVCIIEHRDGLTEGLLMVQASVSWAWDPTTRQQRPVIPKGTDVPVPGYVYAHHHGNGDYRYYK
jgi:hypothetical protein